MGAICSQDVNIVRSRDERLALKIFIRELYFKNEIEFKGLRVTNWIRAFVDSSCGDAALMTVNIAW